MNKKSIIFIAGHNGLVGKSILQKLKNDKYENLLYLDSNHWWTDELHFLEAGWVYHFNAIPPNSMNRDTNYWIERTYKELYE